MTQTNLRTDEIKTNKNITFPIGTVIAIKRYYQKLELEQVFGKYKKKGRDINSLIQALLSYKLTENQSISKASKWINREEVCSEFSLKEFNEKTLFRVLEILGENYEEIILDMENKLFEKYKFEHTNTLMDWTSIVLYGTKCPLGKYGYSRDHRPDKKQIVVGISQLAEPINVPIGMTVKEGNINDQTHFKETFEQVKPHLKEGSLITYDKGANSKTNNGSVIASKMKYLTSKKLNASDDKRIKVFDKSKAVEIDKEQGIYGVKYTFPSRFDYFYFSERLKEQQIEANTRKAIAKFEDAKLLQECLDNKKSIPARFKIKNELVDIKYTYQTKLKELGEKEAWEYIKSKAVNGREGFFCITSSENLTVEEALQTYRKKDAIEKTMNSLKNEIEIKPLRVWTGNSIYGALLIGFIAQTILSLIRYDYKELRHTSIKFLKISLMNLTVTIEFLLEKAKRRIYANFDTLNTLILDLKCKET